MFKTMEEQGMSTSEIARKNWSDQENREEIYRNGETCEIQQIEEGLSLPLTPIM